MYADNPEFLTRMFYACPIKDMDKPYEIHPEYVHIGSWDDEYITVRIGDREVHLSAEDVSAALHCCTRGKHGKPAPPLEKKAEAPLEIPMLDYEAVPPSWPDLVVKINELVESVNTLKRTYIDKKEIK